MSRKYEFARSTITKPMVFARPTTSERATWLRTNPSSVIAACTRSCVTSDTTEGRLRTLDTVPRETPACRATSSIVGVAPPPSPRVGGVCAVLLGNSQGVLLRTSHKTVYYLDL